MEKWMQAAYKFIEQCEFTENIECAFITGSYASGNADTYSDIDLYLILSDDVPWRERGNRLIDGFLIEYFANPARQIRKDIQNNYINRVLVITNMFENCIILFNKTGIFDILKNECIKQFKNGFEIITQNEKNMRFYYAWNDYDELIRSYEVNAVDFNMLYYHFGINLIYTYSNFILSPLPPCHQLYRWLTDKQFQDNYKLPEFSDNRFYQLMIQFFSETDRNKMFHCAELMYNHVHATLENFDINSFSSRRPW